MTLSWACLCLGSILSFAMLHQIVPWTIETILCITSVIRPRLQFFEMGVSLVSVCILLWDILHASFGEGADLSDVFMRSILCWCCSVSFYLFFLCHLFFFPIASFVFLRAFEPRGVPRKPLAISTPSFVGKWKPQQTENASLRLSMQSFMHRSTKIPLALSRASWC